VYTHNENARIVIGYLEVLRVIMGIMGYEQNARVFIGYLGATRVIMGYFGVTMIIEGY
jgi:hypothetical protein